MSGVEFLNLSGLKPSSVKVQYKKSPSESVRIELPIYSDETCKDIYLKVAQQSDETLTSDHIFAWYKNGTDVIPLGFQYTGLTMDHPFTTKELDSRFVTENGDRKLVLSDSSAVYKLNEEFPITTLYYTTCSDYLRYLGFNPTQAISDEDCIEKTSHPKQLFYNAKLRKYWPSLSMNDIFNYPESSRRLEKHKRESIIYQRIGKQLTMLSEYKATIQPDMITSPLLTLSNLSEDENTVHLFRVFSDISVGLLDTIEIPFTKLSLDDYGSTYCKLLKRTISITSLTESTYVSKEVFLKWFRSQVTSIPNTPVSYMDERNSVIFKLYENGSYVSLVIYSTGLAKLVFTEIKPMDLTERFLTKKIKGANQLIQFLNSKKIYSESPISLIKSKYTDSFSFMTASLVYPIKDYKPKLFSHIIQNMTSFVRFNKQQDLWISMMYKRVSDYETVQSKLRVISLLQYSKRKLSQEEIIDELEKIFNISKEEAQEEYDQWSLVTNGGRKIQKGESGIEMILDLIGTNVKVDVSGMSSYAELNRIVMFLNFIMSYYQMYMDTKKDPYKLCKKSKEVSELEKIQESLLADQQDEELIEEVPISATEVLPPTESLPEPEPEKPVSQDEVAHEQLMAPSEQQRLPESVEDAEPENEEEEDVFVMSGLDSDSSSSSGGFALQRGGYNVNRYYLSRLKRFDKELFDGYSVKEHKSKKQGTLKYTYARKCQGNLGRQPIAVTKQDIDRFNEGDEGEGVSFSEAVSIPDRDPNIYYICSKYWDVREDRPRDPAKYEEFKDHIVDNKSSAQAKKNTDKYILRRDEGGYWDDAGDDIDRYKVELWSNFHPKGYQVPCCRAPRQGFDDYSKGWKVDVLVDDEGKSHWKVGIVVSSTKQSVKVNVDGSIQTFDKKRVRRHKESSYITNSFPCQLGSYGHLNPIIKQLIQQPITRPEQNSQLNFGLVRKGVRRGSTEVGGDQSLLESLVEILPYTNSSVATLQQHILYDLDHHPNLFEIAGGAFVNQFKLDITEFNKKDSLNLIAILKKKHSFVHKFFDVFKGRGLKPTELLRRITLKGSSKQRSILNQEIKLYSARTQFERYLTDPKEIVLDTYLTPVLESISRYPSKTFGSPVPNLSILTFEGTHEDVLLSPPMGGFSESCDSMILLYKERGYLYEPILYRKFDNYKGILGTYTDSFQDQAPYITTILQTIQDKVNEFNKTIQTSSKLFPRDTTETYMKQCQLPYKLYLYDNYNKITHIQTNKNVLIPVLPSSIESKLPVRYLGSYPSTKNPEYNDVIETLKRMDSTTPSEYLKSAGITVIGELVDDKLTLFVREIVLESGHYLPIKKQPYKGSIHKLPIVSNISYKDVDIQLGTYNLPTDDRIDYASLSTYKRTIRNLLFQKVYLYIKGESRLYERVLKLKLHPIQLRIHKAKALYELLDPIVRKKVVSFTDEPYDSLSSYEKRFKVVLGDIDEESEKSSDELYQQLLRLFIECMLSYSVRDFEMFLQLDMDLNRLTQQSSPTVVCLSYQDVRTERYLEHFIRYSEYMRNYSLYGEGITRSKLIQLQKQKDKQLQKLRDQGIEETFTKQYPNILRTLFGTKIQLLTHKHDRIREIALLSQLLNQAVTLEQQVTPEQLIHITGLSETESLTREALKSLTQQFTVGFCLVTNLVTKLLQHDVFVEIPSENPELPMILLYQTPSSIIHIQRNGEMFPFLGDLQSSLFRKYVV